MKNLLLLLILTLFLLTLSFPSHGQQLDSTYVRLLDKAFEAKGKGQYKEAIRLMEEAIQHDSSEVYWRYYNLADFSVADNDFDKAFHYLQKVLISPIVDRVVWDKPSFKPLQADVRWNPFQKRIDQADSLELFRQASFDTWQVEWRERRQNERAQALQGKKGERLYRAARSFTYQETMKVPNRWRSLRVPVNDTIDTRCYVRVPPNYDSCRDYPVLLFLHGAVRANKELPIVADSLSFRIAGEVVSNMADSLGFILVIPFANKDFNWMTSEAGAQIVPNTVHVVRELFNVEDQSLHLAGHSNGATGVFINLVHSPSDFAGFFGFNTRPQVMTGGTFLRNAQNRQFYAIAVDKDYYYPKPAMDTLTQLAHLLGLRWQVRTFTGPPHWFPFTEAFREAMPELAAAFQEKRRDPFQDSLYWESDNVRYGRCDWLSIDKLDTLTEAAPWHRRYNFSITQWYDNKNSQVVIDSVAHAFNNNRRSGAVRAFSHDNIITLETSRVGRLSLFISPEMVNMKKPVTIIINGKKKFKRKLLYQEALIRHSLDRQAIWVNQLEFDVSSE
ncbi:tetratricopeptide repeat protein [uncultured Pontibacter sp.]|uniref:tetratricopeptide repeat protein n=1 Tax=uncultured Pontibacter sp. TaxID=453356 RepID=UPI00263471D0|nr:tetratricopeptide repeat protein [uncultured Pontibacter sp.]